MLMVFKLKILLKWRNAFLLALEIFCWCFPWYLTIWRIEPYDFPIFVSSCVFNRCFKFHTVIKPAVFNNSFVRRFSLVELIFIAWQIWNSSLGHWWQLQLMVVHGRWVVWFKMDVENCVVWLPIRKTFSLL